jgi:glycosyltransferase involved in cell wall biosynthesis/thioredoxin-like negative regulator of GroEL
MPESDLETSGIEAFQRREYQRALRLLREAVTGERPSLPAWLWLSRTQLAMDDHQAALDSVLVYLESDPTSPNGVLQLAAVLRRQGERSQAARLLTTLAQNHLDDAEVLRAVVSGLLKLRAIDEAAEIAHQLRRLKPRDRQAIVALATALGNSGMWTEAQVLIRDALGAEPDQEALAKSEAALFLNMADVAWEALATRRVAQTDARHVISIAQHLLQQGHATLALDAAARAEHASPHDPEIWRKSERIRGEVQILRGDWMAPELDARAVRPVPGRILHIVGASAPQRQTGYTVRTQSIVAAQRDAGLLPEVVTPLGFPWTDGADEAAVLEDLDGIPHHRLVPFDPVAGVLYHRQMVLDAMPVRSDDRLSECARRLAKLAQHLQPAALHGASDFRNALPALVTGKSLGIPVVYELRGFPWESWLSRDPRHSAGAETYLWHQAREMECAARADHVVTLAQVMRAELIERGIPGEKITVIPNAVDVERFQPVRRDHDLAASLGFDPEWTVLGYISSIEKLEGIDYLIEATARLRAAGYKVKTLIVGAGTDKPRLETCADRLGIAGHVVFAGRVPHADILRYYSLIDVFVVPRTTDRVCQLVTPLKPYEAMAAGRAVAVSAVPALQEMVVPGETGLTFMPEDSADLAATLKPLIDDPERRRALGRAARTWVCQHRTWSQNGQRYREMYEALGIPVHSDEQRVGDLVGPTHAAADV